jgi:hypothetical protein
MTLLRSSTLGSNEHIPSPLVLFFLGFVCLVSVPLILLTISCLAVTAMWHINLLYYYSMGVYRVS